MCNRFRYTGTFGSLADDYCATAMGQLENTGDVLPKAIAPGLICNRAGERELHPMQFAIAPPDSASSSHPTFAQNFATIEEPVKWPWLTAIETDRCVVPMSSFHVQCYWGDPEGTEAYFQRVDNGLLHVAGVYRLWKSRAEDRQLYTMSLLTRPASDYVMDHGSHRQPIFLKSSGIDAWLSPQALSCDAAIGVLRKESADPKLTHHHLCDMPNDWTQRQKGQVRKRGQQLAAQDKCPFACGF